ncbi:hypothetical protein [Flavobacterium sp.]|uniref:hypothetical protein n=1 Tax=Flavobacterium sp. TaxID=239 RepID=UPI0040348F0C
MKKIQSLVLRYSCCVLLLATVSCREPSGQKSGSDDGREANGDTRGSSSPADNEGSGSGPGATPSKENNER